MHGGFHSKEGVKATEVTFNIWECDPLSIRSSMTDCSLAAIVSVSFQRDQSPEAVNSSNVSVYSNFCASKEFLRFLDAANKHQNILSIVASPRALSSFKTVSLYIPCRREYPAFGCVRESIQWPDSDRLTLIESIEGVAGLQLAQRPGSPVRIFVTPAWRNAVASLFECSPSSGLQGSFSYTVLTAESCLLPCSPRLSQQILLPESCGVLRAALTRASVNLRESCGLSEADEAEAPLPPDYSSCGPGEALAALAKVQETRCSRHADDV